MLKAPTVCVLGLDCRFNYSSICFMKLSRPMFSVYMFRFIISSCFIVYSSVKIHFQISGFWVFVVVAVLVLSDIRIATFA